MKSFLALIKREHIEHRGAFVYAPAVLIGLFGLLLALSFMSARAPAILLEEAAIPAKFYEVAYTIVGGAWFLFTLIMLAFYFAGSFSADRRHNAMLFWKSMPVSDFKILMSKTAAGMIEFPLIVFGAVLITGLMLLLATLLAAGMVPGLAVPSLGTLVAAWLQVSLFVLVYFALALVWYVPFLAWIGGLAVLVGRWAIPLAVLTPLIISAIENIIFFGNVPAGGLVLNYLGRRFDFGFSSSDALQAALISPAPYNAGAMTELLLDSIDWVQMGIGVVFALGVIYLASQYRRRRIET